MGLKEYLCICTWTTMLTCRLSVLQVTGVLTQGRADGNEWVTAFMISHSMNAYNWFYVQDQYGNQKVTNHSPNLT